jgi:hypothetical protein
MQNIHTITWNVVDTRANYIKLYFRLYDYLDIQLIRIYTPQSLYNQT